MQLSVCRSNNASVSFHLYHDLAADAHRRLRSAPPRKNRSIQIDFSPTFLDVAWRDAKHRYVLERQTDPSIPPSWSEASTETLLGRSIDALMAESVLPPAAGPTAVEWAQAKAVINAFGAVVFPLIQEASIRVKSARLIPQYRFPYAWRAKASNWYEIAAPTDIITSKQINRPLPECEMLQTLIRTALPRHLPSQFEIVVACLARRRPRFQGNDAFDTDSDWNVDTCCLHCLAYLRQQQNRRYPVIAAMVIYLEELWPTLDALDILLDEINRQSTDIVPLPGSALEKGLQGWGKIPKGIRHRANRPYLPLEFSLNRAVRVYPLTGPTIKKAMKAIDDMVIRLTMYRDRFVHPDAWAIYPYPEK